MDRKVYKYTILSNFSQSYTLTLINDQNLRQVHTTQVYSSQTLVSFWLKSG